MTKYITSSKNVKINKNKNFIKLFISFSLLTVLFFSFFGTAIVSYIKYEEPVVKEAKAFDPVKWFFCLWGDDSIPKAMYKATQTNDIQYNLFSKSSLNSGIGEVQGGWNSVLNLFGYDFLLTNEAILGTLINKDELAPTDEPPEMEFNAGPKVNVFDRFGIAGLKFTSYAGEWKYFIVDPCSDEDPVDPQAGLFYPERLEPMSTWEEIGNSKDVRTQQFTGVFFPAFGSAFNNHVANFFFGFTKFFVIFAIILVNFAFSDVVSVLGIEKIIAGDGSGSDSIFQSLYNNLFMPLAFMMFAVTGMYMLYIGIVKRQYRNSLGVLARSLALFVAAVIAGQFPLAFVSLPNNIAVVGQSIIINAMGGSLTNNAGLCNTNKGSQTIIKNNNGSLDYQKNQDILTEASENMRSVIACQFWMNFLFRPWVDGQFGTDYEKLWANDHAPGISRTEKELGNENDWVGDAAVPMGDGEFLNNWAIFQLSTQTNAHSPIDRPNEVDNTKFGVAKDWWRVVDAMSNFDLEEQTDHISGTSYGTVSGSDTTSKDIDGGDITYLEPKETKVVEFWDTWVGNNSGVRIWIAISSLFIAIIGLSVPFLFALLSSVYAIGIALLMALAPVMLLLGIWQPQGWEIFKSWAQEVINLTIKRIVFGFLLVLSLIFTTAALKIMTDVGWVQGLLMIIVFALILWKFKDQILNSFASVSFAATQMGAGGKTAKKLKGIAKGSARMTAATAAGAAGSKMKGGTLRTGAMVGAREEFRYQMRRSDNSIVQAARAQKTISGSEKTEYYNENNKPVSGGTGKKETQEDLTEVFCASCKDIVLKEYARKINGRFFCDDCVNDNNVW